MLQWGKSVHVKQPGVSKKPESEYGKQTSVYKKPESVYRKKRSVSRKKNSGYLIQWKRSCSREPYSRK